jgi:hypothetical protein
MTAVMRLDSEKYTDTVTELLSDERAGIVKTACNLIVKTALPDYTKVMEIFRTTSLINTKQKCFSILLTAGKWQRLVFILDVMEIGGDDMRKPAQAALDRWISGYNRSFAVAAPAQIKSITEKIQRQANHLSARMQKQLLFLLR